MSPQTKFTCLWGHKQGRGDILKFEKPYICSTTQNLNKLTFVGLPKTINLLMINHILNGDSLSGQFPKSISGNHIIARECFIEGEISGRSIAEIFQSRIAFFEETYAITKEDYQKKKHC